MASLGKGVYRDAVGVITVTDATIAGDLLFALYVTQGQAATFPTLSFPAGWAGITNFSGSSSNYGGSNVSNNLQGFFLAPGVTPANTTYTFTGMVSPYALIIVLLRCKEQILAGPAQAINANGAGPQPAGSLASSPATIIPNWPIGNPGFDLIAINSIGAANSSGTMKVTAWTPSLPTGTTKTLSQIVKFIAPTDPVNFDVFIALTSRNVGFNAPISDLYSPTPNGWDMGAVVAQLGSTNTASTLSFPKAIDPGNSRGRLRGSGSGGSVGKPGAFSGDPFGGFAPGRWPPIY